MEHPSHKTLDAFADEFASCFPESLNGPRLIGREAEYPVVQSDGSAGDVRPVMTELSKRHGFQEKREPDGLLVELIGPEHRVSLEVGWGTIELISKPCQTLQELEDVQQRAMDQLLPIIQEHSLHILGYGIQPKTPGSIALMSPKSRYHMLLDVIGDTWLSFTTTASDQVHIDVSRDEVLRATNLGNLLSPVIAILFANSPVCAGNPSGFRSSRQGLMGQIHQASFRHGITARPVTSFRDWIQLTAEQEFLIRKENDTYLPVSNMTFVEYADRHTATFDDFLMHDHYIWNSLRPRTAHGTVEWRAACQQPWSSHMTVSAFGLGCIEAMDELEQWLTSSLGDELWPAMQAYEKASLTEGPSAKEPFPGMIQGILERCAQGLTSRGFGEEQYLAPLFEHTRNQHHPAASALEAFADNGVEGLINWANINPKSKG